MYWLPYSSHTSNHPSQTPCLPWISYATQKLMFDSCKVLQKQSEAFHRFLWHFFPCLKQNFIAYHSSKASSRPDCIFEIHQLWQSGFSRVYSNCCCSCSFKHEIIKIGQPSKKKKLWHQALKFDYVLLHFLTNRRFFYSRLWFYIL